MVKKKILIMLALISLVVLVGCSKFPNSCELQEDFCASKGMTYKCGDWKHTTFWCTDDCNNKIPYTLEDLNNYTRNKCSNPKPSCD